MCEFENEHQRFEEGSLGRDFISMTAEAIALRALVDRMTTAFPQSDLMEEGEVESASVDQNDAA